MPSPIHAITALRHDQQDSEPPEPTPAELSKERGSRLRAYTLLGAAFLMYYVIARLAGWL